MHPLYPGFNLISHAIVALTCTVFIGSVVLVLSGLALLAYTLLRRRKRK